jgi:hypothetical protein
MKVIRSGFVITEVDEKNVSDRHVLTLFADDLEEPLIDFSKVENQDLALMAFDSEEPDSAEELLVMLVVCDSEEPDSVEEPDEFVVVMSCQ